MHGADVQAFVIVAYRVSSMPRLDSTNTPLFVEMISPSPVLQGALPNSGLISVVDERSDRPGQRAKVRTGLARHALYFAPLHGKFVPFRTSAFKKEGRRKDRARVELDTMVINFRLRTVTRGIYFAVALEVAAA